MSGTGAERNLGHPHDQQQAEGQCKQQLHQAETASKAGTKNRTGLFLAVRVADRRDSLGPVPHRRHQSAQSKKAPAVPSRRQFAIFKDKPESGVAPFILILLEHCSLGQSKPLRSQRPLHR